MKSAGPLVSRTGCAGAQGGQALSRTANRSRRGRGLVLALEHEVAPVARPAAASPRPQRPRGVTGHGRLPDPGLRLGAGRAGGREADAPAVGGPRHLPRPRRQLEQQSGAGSVGAGEHQSALRGLHQGDLLAVGRCARQVGHRGPRAVGPCPAERERSRPAIRRAGPAGPGTGEPTGGAGSRRSRSRGATPGGSRSRTARRPSRPPGAAGTPPASARRSTAARRPWPRWTGRPSPRRSRDRAGAGARW